MTTTAIQQAPAVHLAPTTSLAPTRAGFFDLESFELMQRISKAFASSDLVPQQYRGNLANCMIALDMAQRIGANPLMTMQNLYVVHGTPGWSSKFLIATVNACGRFTSLRYEWRGEPGQPEYGCRAWAIERETGERLEGIWVTWKMVNAEGWASKSGSKWKTMPDQMFVYRAAAFWQRAYAPELAMGLQTVEDLDDVIDVTPRQVAPTGKPDRVHVPTPGRVEAPRPEPETAAQRADADGVIEQPDQPTTDWAAWTAKVAGCTDLAVLQLLGEDIDALPDSPERTALFQVLVQRDQELADAAAAAAKANAAPKPAAQPARRGDGRARAQMILD